MGHTFGLRLPETNLYKPGQHLNRPHNLAQFRLVAWSVTAISAILQLPVARGQPLSDGLVQAR